MSLFSISRVSISVWEKSILKNISFILSPATVTALLGKNGSGKSSLSFGIFWHPNYHIDGDILWKGENIRGISPDERAKMWLFLSFQNVPEIPGIRLIEYLRTIYNHHFTVKYPSEKIPTLFVFRRMIEKMLPEFGIHQSFLDRDMYVGFSGGEKRRIEMLQIALLDPEVIFLDEIDSWLDIGALDILIKHVEKWRSMSKIILIISHNFHFLDRINTDQIIILKDWQIDRHGRHELVEYVKKHGF